MFFLRQRRIGFPWFKHLSKFLATAKIRSSSVSFSSSFVPKCDPVAPANVPFPNRMNQLYQYYKYLLLIQFNPELYLLYPLLRDTLIVNDRNNPESSNGPQLNSKEILWNLEKKEESGTWSGTGNRNRNRLIVFTCLNLKRACGCVCVYCVCFTLPITQTSTHDAYIHMHTLCMGHTRTYVHLHIKECMYVHIHLHNHTIAPLHM